MFAQEVASDQAADFTQIIIALAALIGAITWGAREWWKHRLTSEERQQSFDQTESVAEREQEDRLSSQLLETVTQLLDKMFEMTTVRQADTDRKVEQAQQAAVTAAGNSEAALRAIRSVELELARNQTKQTDIPADETVKPALRKRPD